jgi:hypothetical protein
MPIHGLSNGTVTPVHRVVAVNRNGWSQSIVTAGPTIPVRAVGGDLNNFT